jgi:hypothetical protein
MRIEITLKNYRCFADRYPAKIVIEDGLTAFVGVNNAGKSTLLRFLYEFRHLFQHFQNIHHWSQATDGEPREMQAPPQIRDRIELYTDSNDRPLTVELRVSGGAAGPSRVPELRSVEFQFRRAERALFRLNCLQHSDQGRFPLGSSSALDEATCVLSNRNDRVCVVQYVEAMRRLSRTLYVGAFRNVLNTGAKTDYFDIQVGDAFIRRWRAMQTGNQRHENTVDPSGGQQRHAPRRRRRASLQAARTWFGDGPMHSGSRECCSRTAGVHPH